MTTRNKSKLKILFDLFQDNRIVTKELLSSYGISRDLRNYYVKSSWLEPLGAGAYKKPGRNIYWPDGVQALQQQSKVKIFVGALSALSAQGFSHYIRYSDEFLYLFSPRGVTLPRWFKNFPWEMRLLHKSTTFLPYETGINEVLVNETKLLMSSPERAIMECLYLSPTKMDLVEIYHIFEGLINLRPNLINELLQSCKTVKIKRLFLYMAEKANHQWFEFIDRDKLDLGRGNRMISKNGDFISRYGISIPKELSGI